MVDKMGDFARSYWPVFAGIVAASVAWGALYTRVDTAAADVRAMRADVSQLAAGMAGTTARAQASDQRIADLFDRVRLLEQRR